MNAIRNTGGRPGRVMAGAASVLILAGLVAGCSTGGTTADSSTGAQAGTNAAVNAQVQDWLTRPTGIGIDESPGVPPKNKFVAYVGCSSPTCVTWSKYVEEAATALGWRFEYINAGDGTDPLKIKNAYTKALDDAPDAVIGSGFPRTIFEDELQALVTANIPVIEWTSGDDAGNGISMVQGPPDRFTFYGKQMADYAMSRTDDVHAVIFGYSVYTVAQYIVDGYTDEINDQCTGNCSVDYINVPTNATDLPSRVATYLQSHPDVNTLHIMFNDMAVGVPEAMKSAGVFDQLLTISTEAATNPAVNVYIRNGDVNATAFDPLELYTWRSFDWLIRHWNGQSTAVDEDISTIPNWILTTDNMPAGEGDTFPLVVGYQDQFKKLWGVG